MSPYVIGYSFSFLIGFHWWKILSTGEIYAAFLACSSYAFKITIHA